MSGKFSAYNKVLNNILKKRAWLFRNWSKMVFIPISVFAPVSNFHSEFKLQGLTQSRKTELKPFLANLGTRMRATVILQIIRACM